MGSLDCPYPDFHSLVPLNTSYLLQVSVSLSRPLLCSILLFFFLLYSFCSSFIFFKNKFLLYLENRFFFHRLQFSSIYLQYSLLYFLFLHSYNILAVYLLSNSLLNLLLSSSFSCHLTSSSSSLQYSFLNSSTNFITFFKFSLFSQVSSFAIHPFHHTRYLFFPHTFLLFIIFSTSHSSSSSITTGCSASFLWPSTYDLYCRTQLTLITGCILTVVGRSNSIALLEIIAFTL